MAEKLDIIGLGEVCIDWIAFLDHLPEPDEKIFAKYAKSPGGVTANFVTAAARLDCKTGFIAGVGDDDHGRFLINTLKANGVDTSHVKVHNDRSTAFNILLVSRKGEKIALQDPNLRDNVPAPEELDEQYLSKARCLHTSAIKIATTEKAVELAKRRGVTVSFDLEKHVAVQGMAKLRKILKNTDVLLPNKAGARELTKEDDLAGAAKRLLSYGPHVVVVTLGGRGCMVVTTQEKFEVPAIKVNAVDTTGAGDAFAAGFLYGTILKGWDLKKAAVFANGVAAIKCLHPGAQGGLPTVNEVKEFLKNRDVPI